MRASAVAGIIFANSHDDSISKLTAKRSMASVPFGGRYRMVDFPLSNLVNAGISNVGIITKENYRSLMDHIGSGGFWDLDRKNGGLHLLPPYNISGARRYKGYVDALYTAMDFIKRCNAEYMVICDSDTVANVDITAAVNSHIENAADVTIVYTRGKAPDNYDETMLLSLESNSRVKSIMFADGVNGDVDFSIGITVFNRKLLIDMVNRAYDSEGQSVNKDIIASKVSQLKVFGFLHRGFCAVMDSEKTYYEANMALLEPSVRKDLFNPERPILTKTRDDMPTRYGTRSVTENCFIADGCVIDGTVKNSVIFRGVRVAKGAVVENSILMQGVSVASNAKLSYVISDKNATIGPDMVLSGTDGKTFIVKKNQSY